MPGYARRMDDRARPLLSIDSLCVDVPGKRLVDRLDARLAPGEFIAVLGPNGTGKTMTMWTLAGLRPATDGSVRIDGQDIASMRRQDLARRLALLTQSTDDVFPASVLDTALIGRHPHVGPWRWESRRDRDIAMHALATMGIADLADRDVLTLSGGERRRLAIAQVLTQQPEIYLLDEAMNHLDPQHQLEALAIFRRLADDGATIIATLHDFNLASRCADRCLLLYGDGRYELGATPDVLDERRLSELYHTPIERVEWRSRLFVAAAGPR